MLMFRFPFVKKITFLYELNVDKFFLSDKNVYVVYTYSIHSDVLMSDSKNMKLSEKYNENTPQLK